VLRLRREDAVYEAGDFPDLETVAEIARLLAAAAEIELAAEAEMILAKTAWARGLGELAAEHGDQALALVADAAPSPAKARVLVERARLSMLGYQHDRTRALLAEGLPLTERFGLDRLRASALITLGTMPGGQRERATLEAGIELAVELGDIQQIQRGYNNLGELLLHTGELQAAIEAWEAAERSTRRAGGALVRWLMAQKGVMRYFTGDWAQSLEVLEQFFAFPGSHYMETIARATRGWIWYARGDTAGAAAEMDGALARARETGDPQALAQSLHATLFFIEEGQPERAEQMLDEFAATGYVDWFVALDAALARASLGRGEELAEQRPRLSKPWQPVLDALAGDDFAAAADGYAALGLRSYEAWARLVAARRLTGAGDVRAAAVQAERARAFYSGVSASRYAREADELLRASA
jgi:tetratricopeptide (TPR) repeat protein